MAKQRGASGRQKTCTLNMRQELHRFLARKKALEGRSIQWLVEEAVARTWGWKRPEERGSRAA